MRIRLTEQKYWTTFIVIIMILGVFWSFVYNLFLDPPYKTNRERRTVEGRASMIVVVGIVIPLGITFAVIKEDKR